MNKAREPSDYAPIDKGMPQERTLLSWRRTALTIVVLSFALIRITLETSTLLASILVVLGLILVTLVFIGSITKYGDGRIELSGGKTAAMLSLSAFALALIEIILIMVS